MKPLRIAFFACLCAAAVITSALLIRSGLLEWPKAALPPEPVNRLSVWTVSRGIPDVLEQCYADDPSVSLDVRMFRTEEQLRTELFAAISAHNAPDFAEISSLYGLQQLAETGTILPVHVYLEETTLAGVDERVQMYFQHDGVPLAVPYGWQVPVLFHNRNVVRPDQEVTWPQVEHLSAQLKLGVDTNPGTDGSMQPTWGLVADPQVQLYWEHLAIAMNGNSAPTTAAFREAISYWRHLIFEAKVMPPLAQPMAISEFIAGRAGFLLTTSDRFLLLERHIGARFPFDVTRMPEVTESIPTVRGFVVLAQGHAPPAPVSECLAYMIGPAGQRSVWERTGKTPVQVAVREELLAELHPSSLRSALLKAAEAIRDDPYPARVRAWPDLSNLLEQVELTPDRPVGSLQLP